MSAPWLDALYLAVLLPVGAAGVALLRRRPSFWTWAGGGALLFAVGLAFLVASGVYGFAFIRLLSHLVFVALPAYLLGAAAVLRSRASAAFGVMVLATGAHAFFVEPFRLEVNTHRIESDRVERKLRIVCLSDIQTDRVGAFERQVLETARGLSPDLVVFPGDFIHESDAAAYARESQALRDLLRDVKLAPALGAFAVDGDVERRRNWTPIFDGTGVRPLPRPDPVDLGPVELVGLPLPQSRRAVTTLPPPSKFRVVFGHAPDYALWPLEADLLVAGHTHGGQVQVPFFGPVLTFSAVPRRWAAGGLVELPGGRHLVVSRGIGMEREEAPRLRFNCRPEIVVIDVVPKGRGADPL